MKTYRPPEEFLIAVCLDVKLGEPPVSVNLMIFMDGQKGVFRAVCKQLIRKEGEEPFSMVSPVYVLRLQTMSTNDQFSRGA
jgi:hypothetical protein